MTLEPDRRSLPGIGHHGYPLARPPAQKLARTGGALHLQASSQFTDSAAAAGLRALEKRVESVPVAVYEFLQAGGVPAAVTIITSEPVAPELRDAAISLLSAVARKQPQAMSLAFTEAKGMAAVVHLLGRGIQPRGGALTEEGAATMAAAARLLEAALNAGGQAAGGAFGAAGGFTALRTALACGQLSGQHATEVAGRAVGLLHRLVWAGNKSFAGPQHAAVCAAVCSARTHQPLLALIYTNSHVDAAVKGMEVLRALAAASSACMHALMQSNCIDTCLTVLDRANLNSNSNLRTALLAALLLHDALDWDRACRADILAKGGVSTCLNVLIRTPSEDAPIADVVNSLLSSLAEGSDDVTHQDGKRLLHWAVQFGEIEALETILDGHPNLEARDERGNTALHLAAAAGHMAPVRLLLDAGADATARNFAGALPHQLAVEGSPLWASLLAELDWRACLEQPRPCQYAATEGDACCSEDWHGPAKCFFLPLSGRVRVESAGVPSPSSKHWFLSAISGHRSKAAQPDQHTTTQQAGQLLHEFKLPPVCNIAALDDLTLSLDFRHGFASATASGHGQFTPEGEGAAGSVGVGEVIERGDEPKGGGRVGRLVIRVDSPPDQRAPDLAHAIRSLLHRCYPASQVVTTVSEAASRAPGNADGHLYHENGSGVNSASAMSPRSTLSHFLSSAEAIQAKRAGSEQLLTPQSRPDMRGSAAPSPSLLQLEGHELDAAGRREEAASSCPETERHAPESVGESEGEVHPAWPGTIEGELGEGVAGPSHPPSQAVEPSQRQVSARSAPGQRRPSSALEIARRLRRTPVSKSGADSADARAGNMSDAKLGSHAGRQDGPESPSASASVSAESGAASSGLGVPADVNLQDGTASSSIGKSGPGRGQGDGKVQSEEDSAAEHVCQALCDAHTTLQSDQNNGASDPPAAAAKGSPANAEHQHEALLVGEQKERSQHRREQEPCFKYGDGARVAMEGTAVADAPKTSSDRAAVKAQHTMSYLPLAENQQRSRKPKAPPPPPPPPPLLRNYGPAATVDPTATAAAVRAADEYRRQQQALGRGKLYASTAQSVADKVRELELQIGLVQQLNSQGLRKEEPPVAHGAKSALPPEVAHTSGEDSAASGELCTVEERTLKTDEQEDGLEAESTAEEGTPGARVTERGTGDEQADGLEAESAPRQGTPGAPGEQPFKTAAAVAMHSAPTCSAARHTRVDAAAVSPVHGTHPSASSSSNATGNMEVDSSVSGTRLSASTSDNADGSTTAESSVSASASTSAEQATRRKSVRKPFYYGPRNTAPEQLQPSAAAAGASAQCEAMPSRQAAESEALQPSRQAKPKRKPFAYGPRPSALDASKAEPAATPVERLGRSAQTIPWLEEKVAAAKTTSGVTASAMQSSTPAGAIFVNGGPIASTMGQSSTPAAIPRGSTGPSETPQRSPRDSVTTEQESSASRTGDTTATELLHSSAADAAPLHRGRSTSVRKPFAYGPRKQEASENMAPNRGLSEVGGEGGSGQGWSADPRFIRG